MPFIQRIVQPVNLAQVAVGNDVASVSARPSKFHCIPGKCQNNNCINNQQQLQQQQNEQQPTNEIRERDNSANRLNGADIAAAASSSSSRTTTTTAAKTSSSNVKDITVTKAIVHSSKINGHAEDDDSLLTINQGNGFAVTSFSYGHDDNEVDTITAIDPMPEPVMPMKKLKQHVEFLSSPAASPTRSHAPLPSTSSHMSAVGGKTVSISNSASSSGLHSRGSSTPQSPTASRIASGHEFDSICNITLSNALRQLASLVLIASDIFDELQRELMNVGERTRVVQRKIVAVEQRVCAFDPKMVTVRKYILFFIIFKATFRIIVNLRMNII